MSESLYSGKCPVHKINIIGDKRVSIKITSFGREYSAPLLYCSKCLAYHIFIYELPDDYKAKSISGGRTVYIRGMAPSNKRTYNQPVKKDVSSNNKAYIQKNPSEKLEVYLIPEGEKLPTQCPSCKEKTAAFEYTIKDKTGKKRYLYGKVCVSCGQRYFGKQLYEDHKDCFVDVETKSTRDTRQNIALEKEVATEKKTSVPAKKKERKNYTTTCYIHGKVLRSPVLWQERTPIFYCNQCKKYYIHDEKLPYGDIVGHFNVYDLYNSPSPFCEGDDPPEIQVETPKEMQERETVEEQVVNEKKDISADKEQGRIIYIDDFNKSYDFTGLSHALYL